MRGKEQLTREQIDQITSGQYKIIEGVGAPWPNLGKNAIIKPCNQELKNSEKVSVEPK